VEGAAVSVAEALTVARAAGVDLTVDGADLVLSAPAPPPALVIDLLSRHKVDIIAFLTTEGDGWTPDDWQTFFDERAGIAEYDSGLPREEAEARAYVCCIAEFIDRGAAPSDPGRCAYCGAPDQGHYGLVPLLANQSGHTWLHPACWESWFRGQQGDAAAALAAMGIGLAR